VFPQTAEIAVASPIRNPIVTVEQHLRRVLPESLTGTGDKHPTLNEGQEFRCANGALRFFVAHVFVI